MDSSRMDKMGVRCDGASLADKRMLAICVLFTAMIGLQGCRSPGRDLAHSTSLKSESMAPELLNPEILGDTGVANNQASLTRLPNVEGFRHSPRFVLPATHEVQPGQSREFVVPEVIELPVPEAHLALSDFEQMALARNPALGQASGRIQALQGKWLQVGLPPNPTAGYAAEEIGDEGTAGKQGGFVSQEFVLGKKLQLNRAIVEAEVAQAEADYAATERRVLTDVQIAFYNVLLAQRRVRVTRDLVGIAEKAVQTSQALFEAEEVGKVALLQSRVEANTAGILLQQAENARVGAWRKLTAVIGDPDMPLQNVSGDLEAIERNYDFQELYQTVLATSPELASALSATERARWALSRAEVEAIPNVNAQVVVQHDNATGDDVAGVQIGIPLPIFDRNQGGIQQAVGEIVTAEQNLARIEMRLRNQLAEVFQNHANACVQVDNYKSQILPQAQAILEVTERGYRAGEMDYLTLLTAQRTYFQTNLSYLDALRDCWSKSAEMEGLLLKDSLDAGS